MKMIIVCQGESDFNEHGSTRGGWLTEKGKNQILEMANRISHDIGERSLVIVSASRRGREAESILKGLDPFRETCFLRDESLSVDDSHHDRSLPRLSEVLPKGQFDSIVVIGHPEYIVQFFRDFSEEHNLPFHTDDPITLACGRASIFDTETGLKKNV